MFTGEVILQDKYNRLMNQVRDKLGHNEFRYYTNLFGYATGSIKSDGEFQPCSNFWFIVI